MQGNEDIDDLFKEIIEGSEMSHSDSVWSSIDNHLEKKSNKKNKRIIFRLRIAIGLLLFTLGSFTYYFIHSNRTEIIFTKTLAQKISYSKVNIQPLNDPASRSITSNSSETKRKFHSVTKSYYTTNINNKKDISEKVNGSKLKKAKETTYTNTTLPKQKEDVVISSFSSNKTEASVDSLNRNILNDTLANPDTFDPGSVIALNATDSLSLTTNKENHLTTTNPTIALLYKEKLDSLQNIRFKNRLSLISYFSPDFTINYLKDNDQTDNENENDYNKKEAPDFSCNTGILLGYDVNKNWTIKVGGTYAYQSQIIKPEIIYARTGTDGLAHYQLNTTYGKTEIPNDQNPVPVLGDSIKINSNSIQSLQSIGIPFISKYQFTIRKFSYYAQVGLSFNFLIAEKLYVETPSRPVTVTKMEGLNEYYVGGLFGLGMSYNPTKKMSILFEPTIKGAITPINNKTPITTRPVSFGLALGLAWHF